MTEVKKEIYILTIDNGVDSTKITSVKKDDKELLNEDNPIDLENEQNAIQQLNSAINQTPQVAGQNNSNQTGGNHHTRKRTHKPRNAKSNTRKGHIYRTNRRRTHGKSSAHGKKQTRRIVNH